MADLISRAYVLAEYDRQHKGPPGNARKIMEEAPAVDAAPVVHGRWQGVSPMVDSMECSVCRYCIPSEEFKTPFCPWCSAKMDGERRDDDGAGA